MANVDGLIIPRSYNDYYSRGDAQSIRDIIRMGTDSQLDEDSENPVQNKVIAALIPLQASAENKLTTKQYVDEQNQTNSAVNRGSFDTYADLIAYSGTVTRNDYAYVANDETHDNEAWRYKWNDDSQEWTPEYMINESPMTLEQLAAINSGITAELVAQIGNNIIDDTSHDTEHALSAAEIDNRIKQGKTYSTEETLTGETWVNGKPIYRKVVNFGGLPNNTSKSVSFNSAGITDTVISIKAISSNLDKSSTISIPHLSGFSLNDVIIPLVNIPNGTITIRSYSDRTAFVTTHIIIEYTKTTDSPLS